ncbi:hypothetical protein L1987_56049 [Smallanthus sonchifolius]|uniref:Uncharacterized protein n=1 Tax=Smallanthus sonchifolius TaxID=185202 RepID=A0ACB9EC25_9ASTR|nr:hypothetical protein L1987_56049 [Smallanthus sonchifolius]
MVSAPLRRVVSAPLRRVVSAPLLHDLLRRSTVHLLLLLFRVAVVDQCLVALVKRNSICRPDDRRKLTDVEKYKSQIINVIRDLMEMRLSNKMLCTGLSKF